MTRSVRCNLPCIIRHVKHAFICGYFIFNPPMVLLPSWGGRGKQGANLVNPQVTMVGQALSSRSLQRPGIDLVPAFFIVGHHGMGLPLSFRACSVLPYRVPRRLPLSLVLEGGALQPLLLALGKLLFLRLYAQGTCVACTCLGAAPRLGPSRCVPPSWS